jgi:hypothetical protein
LLDESLEKPEAEVPVDKTRDEDALLEKTAPNLGAVIVAPIEASVDTKMDHSLRMKKSYLDIN